MNNIWAKIITLDNGEQVLITKGFENEPDPAYIVVAQCSFDGSICKQTAGFSCNEEMDDCFDSYSKHDAENAWRIMKDFVDCE